ncbi:EAL domain-containing protein [Vibrio sp.]|nr:EAL domain-containing protein [Vibrio sp.]
MRIKNLTVFTCIFILVNLICLAGVLFSAYRTIEINANSSISQRFHSITALLEKFERAYFDDLVATNGDCEAFSSKAKMVTFYEPYIRALTYVQDKHLRCDSLYGERNIFIREAANSFRSVMFFAHSVVDPTSAVIAFNISKDDGETVVSYGINLSTFQDIMLTLEHFYDVSMVIGDYEITTSGFTHLSQDLKQKFINNTIEMNGYQVHYDITYSKFLTFTLTNYRQFIFILFFLSFPITYWVYGGLKRLDLNAHKIAKGIKRSEFEPYYQPIFNAKGSIIGCEVLARWNSKSGLIPPDIFIPQAEKSGQIQAIFSQLVTKTIQMLYTSGSLPTKGFHVGINISAPQISQSQFIEDCVKLAQTLKRYDAILVLELTERIHLPEDELLQQTLKILRDEGIKLALDDFGTGYSSLLYFAKIKFDILKIDKTFVDLISQENDQKLLLNNVIDLGRQLKIRITAEGIETLYQYEYLKQYNIDYYQGYYFDKPMPAKDFMARYLLN